MNEETKPCPLCGSDAEHSNRRESSSCTNNDCFISELWTPDSQWNTRPNKWISVEERLPETGVVVLCSYIDRDYPFDGRFLSIGMIESGKWRATSMIDNCLSETNVFLKEHGGNEWHESSIPTHWQPLPAPPKE